MGNLFSQAAANGTSTQVSRNGGIALPGLFKYRKTGSGTATLDLYDAFTKASVATLAIAATDPIGASAAITIPQQYYAVISAVSGSVVIDAVVDGDN